MNISNALFEFTDELVAAANVGGVIIVGGGGHLGESVENPLTGTLIHADVYEEIKPGKTIRIDDLRQAVPTKLPNGEIRRDNAVINLFFIAMPVTQKLSDRLAARQLSEDMATEWLKAMFNDVSLGHRVCLVGQVSQFNDWIKPGTVKMPVCVLRLKVNPRG